MPDVRDYILRCSLFIRFSRRILVKVLSKDSLKMVRMPTPSEVETYQQSIWSKYSMLGNFYAVADELKLLLQQRSDTVKQEMFYNG